MKCTRTLAVKWLMLAVASAILVMGCGGDSSNAVVRQLRLRIFNPDMDQPEGFSSTLSIETVRLRVFQNGFEQGELEHLYNWEDLQPQQLPRLDYGENYQIVVEALNEQEGILADGATPLFDYHQDSNFSEIHILTTNPESIEYVSALFSSGGRVIAAPSEFEGSFIAQSLAENPERYGGQRAGHTLTVLPDGRLVVIGGVRMVASGGIGNSPFARFISTVEVYNPYTGYWSLLRDSEQSPIVAPPPDPIPEGYQEVLVAAPLELSIPRAFHTATSIGEGRIMVVGGFFDDNGRIRASGAAEIIDVNAGTIEVLTAEYADLQEPRALHTAHWMGDKLVVVGGVSDLFEAPIFLNSIEVYEPSRGLFDYISNPDDPLRDLTLSIRRGLHSGTTLPDGIVVAGGRTANGVTDTIEFIEYHDGVLRNYFGIDALPRMATPRFAHSALLTQRDFSSGELTDRYVAIAGGFTQKHPDGDSAMTLLLGTGLTGSVEFFHTWTLDVRGDLASELVTPRAHFTLLETTITYDLLVLGGIVDSGVTNSVERFYRSEDGGLPLNVHSFPESMKHARAFAAGAMLQNHAAIIVGGWDGTNSSAVCGAGTAFTTGCTSEVANLGDLYWLGASY